MCKKIGWNEEGIDGCIIAWPEHTMDQTYFFRRIAIAFHWYAIGRELAFSLKRIRSQTILSLLLLECLQDALHRSQPVGIKGRCIPRDGPVAMRKPYGITQAVYLPLSFMDTRFHIREVRGLPLANFRTVFIKGIGIGITKDTGHLPVDHSADKVL